MSGALPGETDAVPAAPRLRDPEFATVFGAEELL
jgi:hypothetical protein